MGNYKPRRNQKIICKECGDKFLGRASKKYCSKFCIQKIQSRYQKRKYIPKITFQPKEVNCKQCKKKFEQKTQNNIFCNEKCSKRYSSEKYRKISLGLISPIEENDSISFLKLRFEILKRDNFQCKYCGRSPKKDNCKLHIDHIIPKSKGGTNNPENLIASCIECNLGKTDILLEERQLNKIEVFEYE